MKTFYTNLHVSVERREEDNRLVYACFGFMKGQRLRLSPWSRIFEYADKIREELESEQNA